MITRLATRFALSGAVAMMVMAWLLHTRSALIDKGEARAVAKVEKRNDTVRKRAKDAGRKSADPQSPGVLSPYLRD